MFDNVGNKLKKCAIGVFSIGAVLMVIIGVAVLISFGESSFGAIAIPIIVLGVGISWIAALFMYGFGELIERVCRIDEKMNGKLSGGTNNYDYKELEIKKNISSVFKADGVMDIPKRKKGE